MGGCYDSSYSYRSSACSEPQWKTSMADGLNSFFRTKDVGDLVKAYVAFHESNSSGFIKQLLSHKNVAEAPKEFPEIEYELKLTVVPVPPQKKSAEEPSIDQYLDAFEFPAAKTARFLKDAINTNAEGSNHFFGRADEERLVVIEKGGKFYLKEKSSPLAVNTGVLYEELVMKRTERRYEASMDGILKKVAAESQGGSEYQGVIRKEKGDAFVLDTRDGRIFSFTITRAHLQGGKTKVQRQLEIEYAGYVPGFSEFVKDDEKQIVAGMVDIAKQVAFLSNNAPVANGWRMQLGVTNERKYDFVRQITDAPKQLDFNPELLFAETLAVKKKHTVEK